MATPTYIIGIDLGTTNSVVAYTEADIVPGQPSDINIFEIPQLIDAGVVEDRDMLPSFLLVPGEHDVSEAAMALPWDEDNELIVGEFARNRGAELPHRLIASAKSWLCHPLVDRSQPILPWSSTIETESKKSPVEASASILEHIRDAWNYTMAEDDDDLRIEAQEILLTVPASFDAVARELTVKAAEMAGLQNVTLLEEPQAAFYAWIESMGDQWREDVAKGDLVLVCDVGGGTTDFSLIEITEEDGQLVLERIAVGDHLLVGGDNMDLALAYSLAQQMAEKGTRLDNWQMRGLWHSCRQAKERLLADADAEEYPVTILGRGSSLIGGTQKTQLTRDSVNRVLVDGFFPKCEATTMPAQGNRVGLQELGLSYESDPSVTHHLAKFLHQNNDRIPSAVLFNGGIMKADPIRQRITDLLSEWTPDGDAPAVREITSANFDLSVAKGATYYGLARKGRGVRIRYGLNKSYYIGIAASMPAVPGIPAPTKALCIAPFGMEEGSQILLEDREFALVVGQPAKFDFLGSSRHDDQSGDVIDDWEGEIRAITEIETTLDGEAGSIIPVTLEIQVTEVGTLALWCVSKVDGRRWKLEFNVREQEAFEN
ncbi:heat shock protein, Hsp 70 family, related to DnaK [Desulfosarcina variabilis str. Montpellier]|uniref:Hsp70 family protein n=1 Tax=Desulfosarcina variabilis TaxID=2300 RepID=UPI003AFAC712